MRGGTTPPSKPVVLPPPLTHVRPQAPCKRATACKAALGESQGRLQGIEFQITVQNMGGDFIMKKRTYKLKSWELALLLALCITFAWGLWADRTQNELAAKLIRLHVIANSDTPADQAAKLQMRDRVLEILSPALAECKTQMEAADVIEAHREELEALGPVSVTISPEYYPTRHYDTFSLPAGEYLSLRVSMGEAAGRNWWCVVFPPLCVEALADPAEDAVSCLSEAEHALITGEDGYILRFRVVDWWEKMKAALG